MTKKERQMIEAVFVDELHGFWSRGVYDHKLECKRNALKEHNYIGAHDSHQTAIEVWGFLAAIQAAYLMIFPDHKNEEMKDKINVQGTLVNLANIKRRLAKTNPVGQRRGQRRKL